MALNLCVILSSGSTGPGERRFLKALNAVDGFARVIVTQAPPSPTSMPGPWRAVLSCEARCFPAPDSAPPLTHDLTPFSPTVAEGSDVVVDFSMSDAAAGASQHARFGLWRLSAFRDTAAVTEARLRAPTTDVVLTCTRDGRTTALALARYDTKFFASRNAAYAREKSVQLLHRELVRLARDMALPPPLPMPSFSPSPRAGEVADYLFAVGRELGLRAARKVDAKRGKRPGMFFLRLGHGDPTAIDPSAGVDLAPSDNSYWADPFLFEHDGQTFLFYEHYDYGTDHGHLSVGRLNGTDLEPLGAVMEAPHHLSYPFVFRWNDEILMIPETHQAGRIEVWRAAAFPLKWELVSTAFDGIAAADTVVFERDGQWWLLTNICDDSFGDFGTELHLFAIDDPMLGNPRPHPLNPVVIDATCARGGGRVFDQDGRLYRPSQDNSHGIYGYGLNLMEITELSMETYREHRVRHLTPDALPGIMGMHHMDAGGGYTVMDLRRVHRGLHRSGRRQHQNAAAQEDDHQDQPRHRRFDEGEAEAKFGAE